MKNSLYALFSCLLVSTSLGATPGFAPVKAHADCSDDGGPYVDWANCRKRNLIMDSSDFSSADFTRVDFSASDLRNSNFSNANFYKTNLMRASIAGSNAKGANFQSVLGSRTDFSRGDYEGANFSKAEINRSNFSNSNLKNANLSKADFSRVNFFNANLEGVNLYASNLSRANLTEVIIDEKFNLTNAFLFRTNIEGLDLSMVKELKQWQINLSCGNKNTVLPDNLDKPAHWPCRSEDE